MIDEELASGHDLGCDGRPPVSKNCKEDQFCSGTDFGDIPDWRARRRMNSDSTFDIWRVSTVDT
jgi:hypothetical protein